MIRFPLIAALVLCASTAAAEQFGAIAYSIDDDKYGRAWDYSSSDAAKAAAVKFCASAGGGDCKVAAWVEDSCGSVARADATRSISQMGISYGFKDAESSRPRAISECEKRNDGACRIIASVCSWKQ